MKQLGERLIKIHATAGIVFGLLFYVIMYFGIFSIFQNYIKVWEKPSRHFASIVKKEDIPISKYVDKMLLDPNIPKNNLKIILPDSKNDNALVLSQMFIKKIAINPNNGEKLQDEGRRIGLGFFLHNLHTGRPFYRNVGFTIFGIVAVASIFLMLTGLIQVITIKYSNKGESALKKSSKWHRKLSVWFFLPILIIFISGAALNLQIKANKKFSQAITQILSDNEASKWPEAIGSTLFPSPEVKKKDGTFARMLALEELYEKARQINPNLDYIDMRLFRWNDSSAEIELRGYNPSYPFFNGFINLPSVTLKGIDGSVVKIKRVFDAHWMRIFYEFVHFLHFVPFMSFVVKFLLALVVAGFTIGTAFGIWLYLEKCVKNYDNKIPFYHWFSRLSMTIMLGALPATAIAFCLQWLFPFDMEERILFQKGIFFLTWLSMGLIAFARFDSNKAAKNILYIGSVLFLLAPIIHWLNSGYGPIKLASLNMYPILGVDIGLLFLAVLCFVGAFILPKSRTENKKIWKSI